MLKNAITAILLAGGKSSRMAGNDKGLLLLKGKPLYCHVIERIKPQVGTIIINSNQNIAAYQQSGYPVISDQLSGHLGPLAGIYTGLLHSQTDWNLVVSCDTPFLPLDLVQQLHRNMGDHFAAYVTDGEKEHPTILLINRCLAGKIKDYLDCGERKLRLFLHQNGVKKVLFSDHHHYFENINTPQELDYWNQHL